MRGKKEPREERENSILELAQCLSVHLQGVGVGSFSKLYTLISPPSYSFNRGGPLFNILGEVASLGNWLEKQSQVPV